MVARGRSWLARAMVAALLGWAGGAGAQVEANRASAAELQTVRGIGPVLAARIVEARAQGPFAGWHDFEQRVPGVGVRTAQKLSLHGLRIDGRSYGAEVAHGRAPTPAPVDRDAAADPAVATMRPRAGAPQRHPPAPVPSAYPRIPGLSAPTPSLSADGAAVAPRAGDRQPGAAVSHR